ncbi:hypothetical protein STHU_53910 [Allostella humosa]|uniref:hypothetical protein n=1 Tax=Stella humosa TaxID=94 RepID=UPI00113A2507|nr:hypothetical protein [Stella humosa]BBK34757.1 hypothetical protein STHU_53910 [Stella humosa]
MAIDTVPSPLSSKKDECGPGPNPSDVLDTRWDGASIPQKHWHFHRQLLQRYGIVLGAGEFGGIIRAIRTGKALVVERRRGDQVIYSVRLNRHGERIYVLATELHLITAWPPDRRLNTTRRAHIRDQADGAAGTPSDDGSDWQIFDCAGSTVRSADGELLVARWRRVRARAD